MLNSDPSEIKSIRPLKGLVAKSNSDSLQARIQKKLDEELPQERMGGMKLGPKVSGNQGLSKS